MKKNLLVFLPAIFFCRMSLCQPGEWVWLRGSNINNSVGNYGVQGISSPLNDPSALYEPCEWRDQNNNFWMYGGMDLNFNATNDLWRYDPLINEWTWMSGTHAVNDIGVYGLQGIPSPANRPPGRGWAAASWTDSNGDLWFFGGLLNGTARNDLWRFQVSTNEWTWMKGSNIQNQPGVYGVLGVPSLFNTPGARAECATAWVDASGDMWLFGGYDFSGNYYSDLWRYNIASNCWTWMKGPQVPGDPGYYGVKGVEDPANEPGARLCYSRWKDGTGNFWMFGGGDFFPSMNDMWKYNLATNNWTWMNGSNTSGAIGIYGTRCTGSPQTTPGGRFENRAAWTDAGGNFWMFGGASGGGGLPENYNDLWFYCVGTNQWSWVSGDTTINQPGNWGTMGVSSPTNIPCSRGGAISWSDNNNHLYLFGGANPFPSSFNDVWKYTIDPGCISCNSLPTIVFSAPDLCPGTCIDFTNLSFNATSFVWIFPGANPSTSTDVNPTNICYATPGHYDVTLIATNAFGTDTLTLASYITVYPYPAPQGIQQTGDTLVANQGAVSYQWYFNGNSINGATNYYYVAMASGDYNVVATDINGCEVEAVIFNVLAAVSPLSSGEESWISFYPNPADEFITVRTKTGTSLFEISVCNMLGEKISVGQMRSSGLSLSTIDVSTLPNGIYWLEVSSGEKIFRAKFVKAANR